jgi:ribonuclease P protein component
MRMHTLNKNYEFRRLYSKGRSSVTPVLVVYCRRRSGKDIRVGFTVSTKIGHAVVRNRVRRRMREIYRLNYPHLQEGVDLVVVARMRAVAAPYAELENAFVRACMELGIWKGEAI